MEEEDDVLRVRPGHGGPVVRAVVSKTHGRGRVKPRAKELGGHSDTVHIPRIDEVSHKDRESGEQSGDPVPRYPDYVTDDNTCKVRVSDTVE